MTRAKNVSIKKIRKTKGKRMTKDERKTEEQRLLVAIQGFSEMSESAKAVFLKLLKMAEKKGIRTYRELIR